jgi:hypothetical protein
MAKQVNGEKASPFDALRIARIVGTGTGAAMAVETSQPAKQPNSQLAKSVDPEYMKFTTYVRKKTHLAVKSKLVAQERELSDLVEELLTGWLSKQSAG